MKKGDKFIMNVDFRFGGKGGGYKNGDTIECIKKLTSTSGLSWKLTNQNGVILKYPILFIDSFLEMCTKVETKIV